MNTVYLLEDDKNICELVACALENGGVRVKAFHTVAAFMSGLEEAAPDLCLLDVMLPDGNGFEVLSRVRAFDVPCIMLSALGRETDKVKGLNLGAEDYIAKPFGVMELAARVHAALRRRQKPSGFTFDDGTLAIDESAAAVRLYGTALTLTPKEFKLLVLLAENAGKPLTRDKLLTAVWGYDAGETRTVDNHVARLRKAGLSSYIHTVHGLGYKFEVRS